MTSTRSMSEVQAEYIALMGNDLGSDFWGLHRKLIELHIVWQQYQQLFGTDAATVDLLNRTSSLFFKVVQDEIWDSVLLGISRMTDPAQTHKNKNLTIQSLPPKLVEEPLRTEVQTLCDAAIDCAAFAREHRNKRIAHQDHGYTSDSSSNPLNGISQQSVNKMLAALRAVLNRLNSHFKDSTTFYEDLVDESGARVLAHKLHRLEALQKSAGAP